MLKPNDKGKLVYTDRQRELKQKLAELAAKKEQDEPVTLRELDDKLNIILEMLEELRR